MNEQDRLKLINQGYGLSQFLPDEFKNAVQAKITELSKQSPNKEKWQAISDGFEIGMKERTQQRLQKLQTVQKSRGRTQERTR